MSNNMNQDKTIHFNQEKGKSSERNNISQRQQSENSHNPEIKRGPSKTWKFIGIGILIVVVIGLIIFLAIHFTKKKKC